MSDVRKTSDSSSSQRTVTLSRANTRQGSSGHRTTTPSASPPISPRIKTQSDLDIQSDSGTRGEKRKMSSRSSKHHDTSSKKHSSKSKSHKSDDWTDITEPEERRRIQNRVAQRKFREKAKEQKEKAERESRNQENAGSSYRIPDSGDLGPEDDELSGLPWGSISMRHVVARGHESEKRHGSGRDDSYTRDDAQYHSSQPSYHTHQYYAGSRGDSSGAGDDRYYEDQQQQQQQASSYYSNYDPNGGDISH